MGRHRRAKHSWLRQSGVKMRRKKLILSIIGACVVFAGVGTFYTLSRPLDSGKNKVIRRVVIENPIDERDRTTFLLLGTDSRPGEPGGNSDVILIASLDNKNKRIELMSIPRDTKVMFPNGSYGKINEGLQFGGPVMMENLVETLVRISIDKYAMTHFGGMVDVIDTLGGITVNVPKRMYYNTGDKQWNIIDLKPGVQNLNGVQALGFVRYRHDELGDVGRTMRQQQFLAALAQKLLQPSNIPKLPTLVSQVWKTVDTDMSVLQISGLATQAKKFQDYQIIHETLPGAFHDATGPRDQSYWIVNAEQAKYVAENFFFRGIVQKNPIQSETTVTEWTRPTSVSSSNTSSADVDPPASTPSKPAFTTSTASASDVESTQTTVSGAYANLRTGPGEKYDVIGSVLHGQRVSILHREGEWDLVKTDDERQGYIATWLLRAPH